MKRNETNKFKVKQPNYICYFEYIVLRDKIYFIAMLLSPSRHYISCRQAIPNGVFQLVKLDMMSDFRCVEIFINFIWRFPHLHLFNIKRKMKLNWKVRPDPEDDEHFSFQFGTFNNHKSYANSHLFILHGEFHNFVFFNFAYC